MDQHGCSRSAAAFVKFGALRKTAWLQCGLCHWARYSSQLKYLLCFFMNGISITAGGGLMCKTVETKQYHNTRTTQPEHSSIM